MIPKLYYADHIELPLPSDHRFPADKYLKTRLKLKEQLGLAENDFLPSPLASFDDLCLVHDRAYVDGIFEGSLSDRAHKKIGFPWSQGLVNRCRASTGGTYHAALGALRDGYGAQLAGGTHHAHFDFGAGYCVFNDFAVTIAKLKQEGSIGRVAIIDLDVHHGDGNASLLSHKSYTFVFSMHGAKNYPARKPDSDLDIAMEDGTGDDEFCQRLESSLPQIASFEPDLILYQAGVDALEEDRLGRLALSHQGLIRRDEIVFAFARAFRIPIVHVLGGGYCHPIDPTVEAYVNTFKTAFKTFGFSK
ncbi:histone deacetylase family protein [Pseudobacteriovorax antillogorgiicola]|uniref:Acetoin utilization deacetylase AcuC n=1 Tax=Pseudobacteriovorax antillogorgiicola TaxID=1513793 RepID=A0A1Y6C907_9BACT|nr:histone deacetylase [Pseudobacteriovorax antillogorgiicola]TCS49807.1 acetoin utilization deacetylase AcuC-like enzyme [Pseudobacteriovorax antillogorgiicola]SMF43088.1 Acetoin utilization deacetylase AcuC [Pseudobacteriovorax antillogorgiicola]